MRRICAKNYIVRKECDKEVILEHNGIDKDSDDGADHVQDEDQLVGPYS